MLARFLKRRAADGYADDAVAPEAEVLRKVRALELRTRGLVETLFSGEYASVFQGRGAEFSHLRAYQPGDEVRAIDWKVTARRGAPFVRQFVEERNLLVVLVVDVSASGRFGPGERSAGEVAAEIAAALAFAAGRSNDRVALVLVSDRVERFVPPGSGRRHTIRLLADLVSHRPRGRGTDLTPALERIVRVLPTRAVVFVISDFVQNRGAPGFDGAIRRAGRLHDVIGIRLTSMAAEELPDVGWVEMTDPESGRRVLLDTASRRVRQHYKHSVLRSQAEMAAFLSESGVELVDTLTTADPLAALADFLRRRHRFR